MGRKLGFNLGCCTKSRVIQDVEIFLHRTRRIFWIDGTAVPIFLRCRVLFVRFSLNQADTCRKALPAHQAISDTPCDGLLEQVAQKFAFLKEPVPVLGERRMGTILNFVR